MGMRTGIEWTDATWNPVVGCTKVSQGCKHCYAKTLHDRRHAAHAAGKPVPAQYARPFEEVQTIADRLDAPLRWRQPRRIFVNSVSDLFHEQVPDEFIAIVFEVMAAARQHVFQILTKRPERMARVLNWIRAPRRRRWVPVYAARLVPRLEYAPEVEWPLPNVWLGTSVEDQTTAHERIPTLLNTDAAVRFVSCEPLLGAVDLSRVRVGWTYPPEGPRQAMHVDALRGYYVFGDDGDYEYGPLHWVIAGGESGRGARALNLDHARSLRDQCLAAGVPFFFKQAGGTSAKAGGRLLDGREWDELPAAR